MKPSVAIIIVNWNSYEVTKNCLDSMRSLNYNNYQLIVTDNGSDDNSGSRLKEEFPEITLIQNEENLGFTGGNNSGIHYGLEQGFDYLLLLNNDTVVTSNFLSVLVSNLESSPRLGAIQPKIMFDKDRDTIWSAGGKFNKFWFLTTTRGVNQRDKGQYEQTWQPDWITGCCFLVRSEIIRKIGELDAKLFIYYEDLDWSFKIKNEGYQLSYEPSSVIYHAVGMSNKNRSNHNEGVVSPFTHYISVRNHIWMIKRYSKGINKVGAWTYQTVKFIGYCCYFLIRRRFTKLRFVLRGFKDGLIN